MKQRKLNKNGEVNADPYPLDKESWRLGYLSSIKLRFDYQDTLMPGYIRVGRRRTPGVLEGLADAIEELETQNDED